MKKNAIKLSIVSILFLILLIAPISAHLYPNNYHQHYPTKTVYYPRYVSPPPIIHHIYQPPAVYYVQQPIRKTIIYKEVISRPVVYQTINYVSSENYPYIVNLQKETKVDQYERRNEQIRNQIKQYKY